MPDILTALKALSLSQQHEVYPAVTAVYNAAKEARSMDLEREIRELGFTPGEGRKAPAVAVKYRSKPNPANAWAGRGAMPTFLKDEMEKTGLPLEAFRA